MSATAPAGRRPRGSPSRETGKTRRPADWGLQSAGRLEMSYDCSVLDLADRRARSDRRTDLRGEALDGAGPVCVEGLFHLHRLEDDDEVALLDLLALLDGDLDDSALHRGGEGVTGGD